jgi:signal transduction histidine kinase
MPATTDTAVAPSDANASRASWRWLRSLRTRLVLAISLVVTIVIGLQSYLQIRIFERGAESDLREATMLAAQVVADDLELRGEAVDPEQVAALLHEFIVTLPSLRSISIVRVDEAGEPVILASTSSHERREAIAEATAVANGKSPEWHEDRGSLAWYALPVMRGDARWAAVVLTVSREAIVQMGTRGRLITLWLAPIAVVLLTLLLDQLARPLIYRPLAAIRHAMREAGRGTLLARAPVLREDELGAVAHGLNQMLDRLTTLQFALQERVDEATAELRASNAARVEAYQQLLALREQMARSEQLAAVGQTAASVAHQVGTPLNLISGYVQMMLAQDSLDPRDSQRLKIIQQQIARVSDAVRTLLDRARPSATRDRLDVAALVDRLQAISEPRHRASRIRMIATAAPGLPPVLANGPELELALLNLVSNAVDAMADGGELRIDARATGTPARVEVTVSDTGTGIPDDLLPRIFDPWVTTKERRHGTGLGLSITRDVVQRLGGAIEVSTRLGAGTAFKVTLPAAS